LQLEQCQKIRVVRDSLAPRSGPSGFRGAPIRPRRGRAGANSERGSPYGRRLPPGTRRRRKACLARQPVLHRVRVPPHAHRVVPQHLRSVTGLGGAADEVEPVRLGEAAEVPGHRGKLFVRRLEQGRGDVAVVLGRSGTYERRNRETTRTWTMSTGSPAKVRSKPGDDSMTGMEPSASTSQWRYVS
jgi:hypothetical protein